MKLRILIVGEDPTINRMRMQMLGTNYNITAVSPGESLRQPQGEVIDLLLICHTVGLREAAAIIVAAAEKYRVERALWLAGWQTLQSEGVVRIDGSHQPWLVASKKILKSKLLTTSLLQTPSNPARKPLELSANSR